MAAKACYITTKALSDQDDTSNIKKLYFDAVTNFQPHYNQSLSRYGLSDNSTITNHVVKDPVSISVTGVISASPIKKHTNDWIGYSTVDTRPATGVTLVYNWWNEATLLYLEDEYTAYSGYILTRLEPIQKANNAITFNMTFEKAKYVGYQRVKLYQYANADVSKDAATTTSKSVTAEDTSGSALGTVMSNTTSFGTSTD